MLSALMSATPTHKNLRAIRLLVVRVNHHVSPATLVSKVNPKFANRFLVHVSKYSN